MFITFVATVKTTKLYMWTKLKKPHGGVVKIAPNLVKVVL